jgi:adenosylcobinamide-phosphate synthase
MWFGRLMGRVETVSYNDRRDAGAVYATAGVAVGAAAGAAVASTTVAVALAAAGRMLRGEARQIGDLLEAGDVAEARERLPALCGRDPADLDVSGLSAAVIESVAENTVDAVVAPALWGAALGAPGALGYRAINTMDAMVGHHGERYEQFGWAAARLDDAANFVPARATALLAALARPWRRAAVWRAVRRDAPGHPSPNAGVAEAAFAGALGVRLGGRLRYGARVEHRPELGDGPRPGVADIGGAIRLAEHVELLLAGALLLTVVTSR